MTVTVTTAATQATVASKGFAFATTTAGSNSNFTLNGVTFAVAASDTAQNIIDSVNKAQGQTGVAATYNTTTNKIDLTTTKYGSGQTINLTDASGVLASAAGFSTASGTDAVAQVQVGSATVLFTGGKSGADGLSLADADGNTLQLTTAGNSTATANASVGQVIVGSAQFQIGAFSGQNTSLSLGNFASSNLGTGVASGKNLSNLDLTTQSGANQAIQVIDSAIDQVSSARGQIGNFQRNVLQSNIRSLGVASENLSAANSTIMDTDVAAETTNYSKLQILQQAGISVLAQANQAPQQVLRLKATRGRASRTSGHDFLSCYSTRSTIWAGLIGSLVASSRSALRITPISSVLATLPFALAETQSMSSSQEVTSGIVRLKLT